MTFGKDAFDRGGAFAVGCFLFFTCLPVVASAGNYRTRNFIVSAPTASLARQVGEAAEGYRESLALHWLGKRLPPWPMPCPINVVAGPNLAAQGVTQFHIDPIRDFTMEVVGTPKRILDSVLPHEVTHTVMATHFGRPLPRWADEGICTTVEHESERAKHEVKLREFLRTRRGIAMNQLFLYTEYPSDMLPMYAQGYSVCQFLIQQKTPKAFINFLADYMSHRSWTDNVRKHYGYESLAELQEYWLAWVAGGSREVELFVKHQPGPKRNAATRQAPATMRASTTRPDRTPRQSPAIASLALAGPSRGNPPTPTRDGWYLRRRRDVARGGIRQPGRSVNPPLVAPGKAVAAPGKAMVPPSIRNSGTYSSAHPQGEQSWTR